MLERIWDEFLTIIEEEVGTRVVETWFKAVSLHQWDALKKEITVCAPNAFVRDWIHNKYKDCICLHLKRLLNVDELRLHFTDTKKNVKKESTSFVPAQIVSEEKKEKRQQNALSVMQQRGYTNRSYCFSTFVVGPANSFAYAAAKAVTEQPGVLYNPLFIYGDSGLGKTHLLHAIGNQIRNQSKASVLYQTADRFVSEFINAIRFNKIHRFQQKYKSVDVLLVDDIQFISNKDQTQEAFFHIFNTLYDARKQIVFTSDTYPQNINGLANRLQSRLACGLITDIRIPTIEEKVVILKKKAELSNETLTDEVAYFISSQNVPNIRELEGALIRVMAFAALTRQPISLDLVKKVLLHVANPQPKAASFEQVARCVSRYYSYSLEQLLSRNRNKQLSFARQVAMFLMKQVMNKSARDIGQFLGGRDHTTVLHAIHKIEHCVIVNAQLKETIHKIERELGKTT